MERDHTYISFGTVVPGFVAELFIVTETQSGKIGAIDLTVGGDLGTVGIADHVMTL
jgi:hypothetical protein